jgi:hypothetical protein
VNHHVPTRQVPPGSTPLRELAHAIEQALALPKPAILRDELTYLRITRNRARLVRKAVRRILDDHESDDTDVMSVVTVLRDETAQLADASPEYQPEATLPEPAP